MRPDAATEARKLRKFGLTVGGAFLLLGILVLWRGGPWLPFLLGGGALLIGALVAPRALRPVERVWMRAAMAIGFIMTRVILVLAFYLVITPMGLFLRLLGKDLLARRIERDRVSYWTRADTEGSGSRPEKPY